MIRELDQEIGKLTQLAMASSGADAGRIQCDSSVCI